MKIRALLEKVRSLPPVMHLEIDGGIYKKTYQHSFCPPTDPSNIVLELSSLCTMSDELESLYQTANGVKLFHSESDNDDSGRYFIAPINLYSLDRLAQETAYMQSQVYRDEDAMEYEPPIYSKGLVIGEAEGTGNPLVLLRWGAAAGGIVYADHDPDENEWGTKLFADSLQDLLTQIALPPHQPLCNICGADRIWFESR